MQVGAMARQASEAANKLSLTGDAMRIAACLAEAQSAEADL